MVQTNAPRLRPGTGIDGLPGEGTAACTARNEVGTADSLALLKRLQGEFDANAARPRRPTEEDDEPHPKTTAWRDRRRVGKAAVGLVLLVVLGWMPVRALLQTTSTEAVVNARLVSLRAPIEGEIEQAPLGVNIGSELVAGQAVLRIVNGRAERGRLADLRRLIDQLSNEREGLTARITELTALYNDLGNQVRVFQGGRLRQLTERAAELRSELAAAHINRDMAAKALARIEPILGSGSITATTLEKYTREAQVTVETYLTIQHRLGALEVELQAARQGTFIGDSYNDRPRSSQRVDELGQRLGELKADLRERDARLLTLRKELAEETNLFNENSAAEIVAPVESRVWEMLTAPGESVVRGQDLIRLLDCSGLVVTATVGEGVYNRLYIGQSATFQLRGEYAAHAGRIISLTGVSAAPANFAIQPSAMLKEPYRVTVKLTDLDQGNRCKVGRTGRVTFGE
jgi:multidrug resistance efflux pump